MTAHFKIRLDFDEATNTNNFFNFMAVKKSKKSN